MTLSLPCIDLVTLPGIHVLCSFRVASLSLSFCSATTTGSAGKHWKNEKIFTVGLLGLIPLGLVYPSAVVDYGLAVAIPLHGHWSVKFLIVCV